MNRRTLLKTLLAVCGCSLLPKATASLAAPKETPWNADEQESRLRQAVNKTVGTLPVFVGKWTADVWRCEHQHLTSWVWLTWDFTVNGRAMARATRFRVHLRGMATVSEWFLETAIHEGLWKAAIDVRGYPDDWHEASFCMAVGCGDLFVVTLPPAFVLRPGTV